MIKDTIKNKALKISAAVGTVATSALACVTCFAEDTTSVAVTSSMLQPIVTAVTENIAVILPVGITIFGIFIGLKLVPRIISKFTH